LAIRAASPTLYERTCSHLFAVVLRIHRDRAEAEDVLQEFMSMFGSRELLRCRRAATLTWLTSIARNRAIDSLRRGQTRPQAQLFGTADGA
jgi:RNA polymerase sigma-70 factor (ECF subfamily)